MRRARRPVRLPEAAGADADLPSPGAVAAGRAQAIANLDRTIDSLFAALGAPALAPAQEAVLNAVLKEAIVARAALRHLPVDWRTVAADMQALKAKLLAMNGRLDGILAEGGQAAGPPVSPPRRRS
jgi:hypothetical protein